MTRKNLQCPMKAILGRTSSFCPVCIGFKLGPSGILKWKFWKGCKIDSFLCVKTYWMFCNRLIWISQNLTCHVDLGVYLTQSWQGLLNLRQHSLSSKYNKWNLIGIFKVGLGVWSKVANLFQGKVYGFWGIVQGFGEWQSFCVQLGHMPPACT